MECPISGQTFKTPVMLVGCGHSFEKKNIMEWLERKSVCPICRTSVKETPVINYSLKEACNDDQLQIDDSKHQVVYLPRELYSSLSHLPLVSEFVYHQRMWEHYKLLTRFIHKLCHRKGRVAVVFGSVPLYLASEDPVWIQGIDRKCLETKACAKVSKFKLPRAGDIDIRVTDHEEALLLKNDIIDSFAGGFCEWSVVERHQYVPSIMYHLQSHPSAHVNIIPVSVDIVVCPIPLPSCYHEAFALDCTEPELRPAMHMRFVAQYLGENDFNRIVAPALRVERIIVSKFTSGIAVPIVLGQLAFLELDFTNEALQQYMNIWNVECERAHGMVIDNSQKCYLAYIQANCLKRWKKILRAGYCLESISGQSLSFQLTQGRDQLASSCSCGQMSGPLDCASFEFDEFYMNLKCVGCEQLQPAVRLIRPDAYSLLS